MRAKPTHHRASPLTRKLHKLWTMSRALDKKRKAMHPGRRVAKKSHKVYYEYRANRSDRNRSKRL